MSPFASYIVETLVTLVAVVALAVLVLYGARRLGVGRPLGSMELVGRLPLDARRSVCLVRVAEQVLILGVSEAGIQKLGDLSASSLPAEPATGKHGFADILARLRLVPPAPTAHQPSETPDQDGPPAKERTDV